MDLGFLAALEASRRSAIIKAGGKAKEPKFPAPKWSYPILQERRYSNWAVKLFQPLREVGRQFAKDYPALLKEYQGKTDQMDEGFRTDATSQELTIGLRRDLEEAQQSMDLGPTGTDYAYIYATGDALADWNAKYWSTQRALALGHVYDIQEPWMQDALTEWTETNTKYFRNLSTEFVNRMESLALEAIQTGKRPEALLVDLLKLEKNLGYNRARLIAEDQTGKLLSIVNEKRSRACGLSTYTWSTARDERVRPTHKVAEGKIGTYEDSAVWIDEATGKPYPRGGQGDDSSPGIPVRCRCTACARWSEILKPIDASLLSDPYVEAEIQRLYGK